MRNWNPFADVVQTLSSNFRQSVYHLSGLSKYFLPFPANKKKSNNINLSYTVTKYAHLYSATERQLRTKYRLFVPLKEWLYMWNEHIAP